MKKKCCSSSTIIWTIALIWIVILFFLSLGFLWSDLSQSMCYRKIGLIFAYLSLSFILGSFVVRIVTRLRLIRSSSEHVTINLVVSLTILLTVLLLYLLGITYVSDNDRETVGGGGNPSVNSHNPITVITPYPAESTTTSSSGDSSEPEKDGKMTVFLGAVAKAWQWVSLRYTLSEVSNLMQNCGWYAWAVYLICVAIIFNVVSVTYALLGKSVFIVFTRVGWEIAQRSSKTSYMIIGNNEENRSLYASLDRKTLLRIRAVIADTMGKEDQDFLYRQGIRYLDGAMHFHEISEDKKVSSYHGIHSDLRAFLSAASQKNDKDVVGVVVINTGDDNRNIELSREVVKFVKNTMDIRGQNATDAHGQLSLEKKVNFFSHIEVYVFGDIQHEAVFNQISRESLGVIRYVNKYRCIATDFAKRYPLPLFMNNKQLDYETGLVRDDVEINVCLIGFGDINQQLLNTLVATNQFIQKGNKNIPRVKLVKYYIFDHVEARNNKNLNHSYYRYMNEFYRENEIRDYSKKPGKSNQYPMGFELENFLERHIRTNRDDYNDLPHFPAEEFYHKMDVNDPEFYHELRDIGRANPKGINYFVIAYGSDMENIDMAQKIREKMVEWSIPNIRIFARTRKKIEMSDFLRGLDEASSDKIGVTDAFGTCLSNICFTFGCEEEMVFNFDSLQAKKWYDATLFLHCMHECEEKERDADGKINTPEVTIQISNDHWNDAYCEWYAKKSTIGRDSCLLSTLGIRPKMLMIGYDIGHIDKRIDEETYRTKLREVPSPFKPEAAASTKSSRFVRTKQLRLRFSIRGTIMARITMVRHQTPKGSAPQCAPKNTQLVSDVAASIPQEQKKLIAPSSYEIPPKPLQNDYNANMFIKSQGTIRDNLAIQEHYRWCAFQISRGVVPATKEESCTDKEKPCGRDYRLRRHGCLTTVEGLNAMICNAQNDDERKDYYHAISSNYWAMDDAPWYLERLGRGVVPKHEPDDT